jgi:hypothetical protein
MSNGLVEGRIGGEIGLEIGKLIFFLDGNWGICIFYG